MRINNFFKILVSTTALGVTACAPQADWFSEYGDAPTGEPVQIMSGAHDDDMRMYGDVNAPINEPIMPAESQNVTANIAALLPLTGTYADIGNGIRTAIEMAYLQRPGSAAITFYDVAENRDGAITAALATNPEIIIGPVFADDVRALRTAKPITTPVLAFTSDADAIGNGVMTMALMPHQSIEVIMKQMLPDGIRRLVIFAPDTTSGHIMAGAARDAAQLYDIGISGISFYSERNSETIKTAAMDASLYTARRDAHTRAREILADILTNEDLNASEKASLNTQLEKLAKTETLGRAPFDAVLFLGDGADSKTLASFLRYYGVGARDARFYGTALWDESDVIGDFTMSGARFATLPETSPAFNTTFATLGGYGPGRLASFGYDATNLATGMIRSEKTNAAYLLDPSGFRGIDGLVRMTPNGANERALRVMQLNGTPIPTQVRAPAVNFMTPLYNIDGRRVTPARAMPIRGTGVNPCDYIKIGERFSDKYPCKTYGATHTPSPQTETTSIITITQSENDASIAASPEFQPASLEPVSRTLIDAVELTE